MSMEEIKTQTFVSVVLLFVVLIVPSVSYVFYIGNSNTGVPNIDNEIKVMTYNLHYGIGMDGKFDPSRIAQFVDSKDIDVVGFEELSHDFIMNTGADFASLLCLEMKKRGYVYHAFSDIYGAGLFNGIFSKYPIKSFESYKVNPTVVLLRTVVKATIEINGQLVDVFDTHLTHIYEDRTNPERVKQVEFILDLIKQASNKIILMGDFNSLPDWPEIIAIKNYGLTDAFATTNPNNNTATWPANYPYLHIDYIFLSTDITPISTIIYKTTISDHLPLVATVQLS